MHRSVENYGGMSILDCASASAPSESQSRADNIVFLLFCSSLCNLKERTHNFNQVDKFNFAFSMMMEPNNLLPVPVVAA